MRRTVELLGWRKGVVLGYRNFMDIMQVCVMFFDNGHTGWCSTSDVTISKEEDKFNEST